MAFRLSKEAERDIVGLYVYGLLEFGTAQADEYHDGLNALFRLLADNPRMGREWREFRPPVRLHPYRSHLVIYVVEQADILVVRVLHMRADWKRHL